MASTALEVTNTTIASDAKFYDQVRTGYFATMTERERIEANLGRRITNGEYQVVSQIGKIASYV